MRARTTLPAAAIIVLAWVLPALPGCLSYQGQLSRAGPPDFVVPPYLQFPTQTEMTLVWTADQPVPSTIRLLSDSGVPEQTTVNPEPLPPGESAEVTRCIGYIYGIRITGLRPGTHHRYEVSLGKQGVCGSFRTNPAGLEPFAFALFGDSRTDPAKAREVAGLMAKQGAAFALHTGDLVDTGKIEEYKAQYFDPLACLIGRTPILPAIGNHEGDGAAFRRLFALPGDECYYSWDYANAHFVVLNTQIGAQNRPRMLDWLDRDLARSTADWKIVIYHAPSYDVAPRRTAWGRQDVLPLLRKHKVDLVAAGHSHGYQRFYPMFTPGQNDDHPITFLVTAGGGAPLHRIEQSPFAAKAVSDYNFVLIRIDGQTLSGQALDRSGRQIDCFGIAKRNGAFGPGCLAQAKSELDFDVVRDAILPTLKGVILSAVPQPGRPAKANFSLGAGPFGMKFRLTLAGGGHYTMEPKVISGECAPNATVPVAAIIHANGQRGKRGPALHPDVQFYCEYEVNGQKGTIYGGSLRWAAPAKAEPALNEDQSED